MTISVCIQVPCFAMKDGSLVRHKRKCRKFIFLLLNELIFRRFEMKARKYMKKMREYFVRIEILSTFVG